jgi:hypothetical protein
MTNIYTCSLTSMTGVTGLLFGRGFYIYIFSSSKNDALVIMFETFVVAVTLSNTIGTLRMLKGFQANSLTRVIVEQSK